MSSATVPALDVQRLRSDFPILHQMIHGDQPLVFLDNAASTQRPRQVIDAIVQCYESYYANVHRGIHWLSERSTDRFEQARQVVVKFLNAASEREIIFTAGCTAAVNTVARSWGEANLRSGDLVLATEMEHHANLVPWFQVAEKCSAKTRLVRITDDGLLDMDDLRACMELRPKLLAVTAVSNVLGTINPIEEIVKLAHQAGTLVLVDAAQAAPHQKVDVQAWDADFVVFSGHKVMGPNAIGVLYGKESLLKKMPPFLGGGGMIRRVMNDSFSTAELPAKFEAGTPPIAEAIGLAAAIEYLTAVGLEQVEAHERHLVELTHRGMTELGGVQIIGPSPEHKAGIVSFVLDNVHSHDVAHILDQYGVAVRAGHHCAMPLHKRLGLTSTSRASFYLYNTAEEVQKLIEALAAAQQKFKRK